MSAYKKISNGFTRVLRPKIRFVVSFEPQGIDKSDFLAKQMQPSKSTQNLGPVKREWIVDSCLFSPRKMRLKNFNNFYWSNACTR